MYNLHHLKYFDHAAARFAGRGHRKKTTAAFCDNATVVLRSFRVAFRVAYCSDSVQNLPFLMEKSRPEWKCKHEKTA